MGRFLRRSRRTVPPSSGELVFEVEDLGEGGGRLIGPAFEADEEPAHLGLPASRDGGCREVGLRGVIVVGLVVPDEAPALAEEQRVVAPAGGGDLGEHLGPHGVCRSMYSSSSSGLIRSWKQTRRSGRGVAVGASWLVIESLLGDALCGRVRNESFHRIRRAGRNGQALRVASAPNCNVSYGSASYRVGRYRCEGASGAAGEGAGRLRRSVRERARDPGGHRRRLGRAAARSGRTRTSTSISSSTTSASPPRPRRVDSPGSSGGMSTIPARTSTSSSRAPRTSRPPPSGPTTRRAPRSSAPASPV